RRGSCPPRAPNRYRHFHFRLCLRGRNPLAMDRRRSTRRNDKSSRIRHRISSYETNRSPACRCTSCGTTKRATQLVLYSEKRRTWGRSGHANHPSRCPRRKPPCRAPADPSPLPVSRFSASRCSNRRYGYCATPHSRMAGSRPSGNTGRNRPRGILCCRCGPRSTTVSHASFQKANPSLQLAMSVNSQSKRILFLSTTLAKGGAETQLIRLAISLKQRNWEVAVCSISPACHFAEELDS